MLPHKLGEDLGSVTYHGNFDNTFTGISASQKQFTKKSQIELRKCSFTEHRDAQMILWKAFSLCDETYTCIWDDTKQKEFRMLKEKVFKFLQHRDEDKSK